MPIANILGVIVILAIAIGLSEARGAINYKNAARTLGLQFVIAIFALTIPVGNWLHRVFYGAKSTGTQTDAPSGFEACLDQGLLSCLSEGVTSVISFSNKGSEFVFGPLANADNGFILAFQVFPIIIFISTVFAILFHLRVMDIVIKFLGGIVRKITGASRLESTVASASIFIGMVEAPLAILPYLKKMSRSQMFTVMSCGLASIAGTVLVTYVAFGVRFDLLLTASFMAAPGGLLMGRLLVPETGTPFDIKNFKEASEHDDPNKPTNLIEAATSGAIVGLEIMLNVIAVIIAFVAVIAMVNAIFGGIGGLFGHPEFSLEYVFGIIFAPIAWLIGVPWEEARAAGPFLGQKLVANEFLAYLNFTKDIANFSDQAQIAITVALCGFSNFVGVGILMAGLGAVVPERKQEISKLGMKALLAGSLSNFMSAALVGIVLWGAALFM